MTESTHGLRRRRIEAQKALWRARWEEAMAEVSDEELRIASGVLERIGGIFEEPPAS